MSSTDSSSSGLSTSDIVGIVIGGVIGLVMVISLVFSFYTMCCKKNNQSQVWAQPAPYQQNGPYGQPMNTGYYPQHPPYHKQPAYGDQPPAYSAVYPGSNSYGKY
jgi:hypothetical protein